MIRFGMAFLALGIALSACVTRNVQLDARHVDAPSKRELTGKLSCALPSYTLVDARAYKRMGWVNGHELLYPHLFDWIESTLQNAAISDAQARPLLIEISRAYMETHPSGHSFQLVLRVRSRDDDHDAWRVYRGNESGVTWWGNDLEFGNYVEDAGKKALGDLLKKEGRCS